MQGDSFEVHRDSQHLDQPSERGKMSLRKRSEKASASSDPSAEGFFRLAEPKKGDSKPATFMGGV